MILTEKKTRAEKLGRFIFANKFDTSLLFENGASAKLGEHNAIFFLHEIDGQSGVSILWVHTAQLEFGTKTAALQLSGHHACTSRMWETRKLELGQFKKIFLLFCHLIKLAYMVAYGVQYAQSLEFWKLVEFGTKTVALPPCMHFKNVGDLKTID